MRLWTFTPLDLADLIDKVLAGRAAVLLRESGIFDFDVLEIIHRGRRVVFLPGSDSWKDWLFNLLPGVHNGKWRLGFYLEAKALIERLPTIHRADIIVGFSRGAAIATILADELENTREVHTLGCPGVAVGEVGKTRIPSRTYVGTRDIVALAPITRYLGWTNPAREAVFVPGARHSLRSYARCLRKL